MVTKKSEEKAVKKDATQKIPSKKEVIKNVEKKAVLKKDVSSNVTDLSKSQGKRVRIEEKFSGRKYSLGVGKRKTAVALVRIYEGGKGEAFVNNEKIDSYFFGTLLESALSPLSLTGKTESFDMTVKIEGGGVSAQSDAMRHGIARALVEYDADLRPVLKKAGFLTRDARIKERKKPGLKGARRSPQWAKR